MNSKKSPISILQEIMHQRNKVPHYQLLSENGIQTHKPTFVVRVYADSMTAIGRGNSKKVAKQEAAKNYLQRLGIEKISEMMKTKSSNNIGSETKVTPRIIFEEPSTSSTILNNIETSSIDINIRKKAVDILKYYTRQLNLPSPSYEEISACGPEHQKIFTYKCTIGSFSKEASGSSKIESRDTSALLMFEALKKLNFEIPINDEQPSSTSSHTQDTVKIEKKTKKSSSKDVSSKTQEDIVTSGSQDRSTSTTSMKYGSIDHFLIIKNYMIAKNISYDDLWKDNNGYDFQTLQNVFHKLGIKYNLSFIQKDVTYVANLLVNIIPAFYLIELGNSIEESTKSVAKNMLYILKIVTK